MAMLRVHLMQNWFGYSDPAMEESLYETTILRQFAWLRLERIPDETTILNFRRQLVIFRPVLSASKTKSIDHT
jgi:IS5 family transposase